MSSENVEIVRAGWNAWLNGDLPGLFRRFDPKVVWDTSHFHDWPESAYHGIEGVERFLREWVEVWDEYELGVEEILVAPDGRVISLIWQRGKGRHSRLSMDMKSAHRPALGTPTCTELGRSRRRDRRPSRNGSGSGSASQVDDLALDQAT